MCTKDDHLFEGVVVSNKYFKKNANETIESEKQTLYLFCTQCGVILERSIEDKKD